MFVTGVRSDDLCTDVFWSSHDPAPGHRQGPDGGSQYRSAIFTHDSGQVAAARASKERLQSSAGNTREIVTEITPATAFYRAEDYHQQYLKKARGRRRLF